MHNLFTPSRPQKQSEAGALAKSRKQVTETSGGQMVMAISWTQDHSHPRGIYYMS